MKGISVYILKCITKMGQMTRGHVFHYKHYASRKVIILAPYLIQVCMRLSFLVMKSPTEWQTSSLSLYSCRTMSKGMKFAPILIHLYRKIMKGGQFDDKNIVINHKPCEGSNS